MKLEDIEHSGYSQNGEDGIIARLIEHVGCGDRTVVEIGAGTGAENNSRALLEQGWRGVLFERMEARLWRLRARVVDRNWDVTIVDKPADIATDPVIWRPQLFSLDIDSYDWHVAAALLARGFRPAIAVVEYNAVLDPKPFTVPNGARCDRVYFGCSLAAWRALFGRYGYRFVTVCSAGINAFFLRDADAPDDVAWLPWRDQQAARHVPMEERRAMIGGRSLVKVAK